MGRPVSSSYMNHSESALTSRSPARSSVKLRCANRPLKEVAHVLTTISSAKRGSSAIRTSHAASSQRRPTSFAWDTPTPSASDWNSAPSCR